MGNSRVIKEALGGPLGRAGFGKKSDNWYRNGDGVVQVVNLQKSQYGNQYYINAGVAMRSLGADLFPKEQQCHVRFRLSAVSPPEKESMINESLNLDKSRFSDPERASQLSMLIEDILLEVFGKCDSEQRLLEAVKSGMFDRAMVHRRVKEAVLTLKGSA